MVNQFIVRFLTEEKAKYIFRDGTFGLCSYQHYRRLEEAQDDCWGGDKLESRCSFEREGITNHHEDSTPSVISCWSGLKTDMLSKNDWGIFPETVIAIVSSIAKVKQTLMKNYPVANLKDGLVVYYPEQDYEKAKFVVEEKQDLIFLKRDRYSKQNEHRFVLWGDNLSNVDQLVLRIKPSEYIEKVILKSQLPDYLLSSNFFGNNAEDLVKIYVDGAGIKPFYKDKLAKI